MQEKRAILWDFDGVLCPTEKLRDETHQEVVKHFGGQAPPGFYKAIGGTGRAHEAVRAEFIRAGGIAISPEGYTRLFQKLLAQRFAQLSPTPGVAELLFALQAKGNLLAVVSSSPRSEVLTVLIRNGFMSFFTAVICGEEVACKKPAPDGYLMALKNLKIRPARAVAIEDSQSGIEAAWAAGLKVIAFRHEHNQDHNFSKAAEVITTFNGLKEILERVVR